MNDNIASISSSLQMKFASFKICSAVLILFIIYSLNSPTCMITEIKFTAHVLLVSCINSNNCLWQSYYHCVRHYSGIADSVPAHNHLLLQIHLSLSLLFRNSIPSHDGKFYYPLTQYLKRVFYLLF